MTTSVTPRFTPQEAFQWLGQFREDWPSWVRECCTQVGMELNLIRSSGVQVVRLSEWIVRDLDGEPLWFIDADLHRVYVVHYD